MAFWDMTPSSWVHRYQHFVSHLRRHKSWYHTGQYHEDEDSWIFLQSLGTYLPNNSTSLFIQNFVQQQKSFWQRGCDCRTGENFYIPKKLNKQNSSFCAWEYMHVHAPQHTA